MPLVARKKHQPGCPCCDVQQDYHLYWDGGTFPSSTGISDFADWTNLDPAFDIVSAQVYGSNVWLSHLDDIWVMDAARVARQSYAGQNEIGATAIDADPTPDMKLNGWAFCSPNGAGWANAGTEWFSSDEIFIVDGTPSVVADKSTKTNRSFNLGGNLVYNPAAPEWFSGNTYRNQMTGFCLQSHPKIGFTKYVGNLDQFTIWLDDLTIQDSGGGNWLFRIPTAQHTTPVFSNPIVLNDCRFWCDYDETKSQYYWIAGGYSLGGTWNYSVKLPWKTADQELPGPSAFQHYPMVICDTRGDVVALYLEGANDRRLRYESGNGLYAFNFAVAGESPTTGYYLTQSENWIYVWDIYTNVVTGLDYAGPNTNWWRINKKTYAVEAGPNNAAAAPKTDRTFPVQVNGKGY